jgi:hypothetical protein
VWVRSALPSGVSRPSAGSRTLARSQGKLHCDAKVRNCLTPKSRSWFLKDVSSVFEYIHSIKSYSNTSNISFDII